MGFINNMKIGFRLNIILSLVMVLTISSLGIYTINIARKTSIEDADAQMTEQVQDLSKIIEIQIGDNQKRVDYALHAAHELISFLGEPTLENKELDVLAINQLTKESQTVKVNNFKIGDQDILNNISIVDKIMEITGATATIFQKIPNGFLRISTNVLQENGDRAVGTFIPKEM